MPPTIPFLRSRRLNPQPPRNQIRACLLFSVSVNPSPTTGSAGKSTAIRSADPNHLITIGHIQWAAPFFMPGVQHYAGFNLKENAKFSTIMTIHFYPLDWPRPCDDPSGNFVNAAYLQAVLFQADAGKPLMLGEFRLAWRRPDSGNGKVHLPASNRPSGNSSGARIYSV